MSFKFNVLIRIRYCCLFLLFFFATQHTVKAQEEEVTINEEVENESWLKNKLSLYTGYAWVPKGRNPETGNKQTIFAPSLGLSYEYWFAEKWAISTYDDIDIIKVGIQEKDNKILERENAILLTVGFTYEVIPKWTFAIGAGIETDKNETLKVMRFGSEYVILEKNEWELSVSLCYINKDVYDIIGIGFVFGKKF
ncbi:hypothetical protein [Robertkochia solimangrovi]|uniref:hypothetical protein n=1 Tax=Robertkochia solimangrovi TaxID=2213046 RepID=UPI00117EAC0A|nr:hypothetical protein [Robertkochia solimangrovi]TRZ45743.1 hypothetical protein DMZ48_00225 [Robertkochia solimangrovi]